MARKGPPPKANTQRTNSRPELVVTPGGDLEVPAAGEWAADVVDQWEEFWLTPQAATVDAASLPVLRRLFDLRDEIGRLWAAIHGTGRMVEGSQGQQVVNPAYRVVATLQTELRMLEDRFAMTPDAKVRLGLKIEEGKRSLDDFNRAAAERAAGR